MTDTFVPGESHKTPFVIISMNSKIAELCKGQLFFLLCCAVFLIYGLIVANIIIDPHYSFTAKEMADMNLVYMEGRRLLLEQALDAARTHNYNFFSSIRDHNTPYYFYLAMLADIKGGPADADTIFLAVQMKAAIFLLAIYPVMFFMVSKSKAITFLSPWFLDRFAGSLLYESKTDSYWVMGWIIALAVPLLWFLWKRKWGVAEWCAFCFLSFCIALANLPRAHGALPAAVALLVLIGLRMIYFRPKPKDSAGENFLYKRGLRFLKQNKAMMAAVVILVFSYPFFTDSVIRAMRAFPNAPQVSLGYEPWHSFYIGLGYLKDNPYGIYYSDHSAHEKVRAIDPTVVPWSKEHMAVLKREYFKIWCENPQFIIKTYAYKFVYSFKYLLPSFIYKLQWFDIFMYSFVLICLVRHRRAISLEILKGYLAPILFCILAGFVAIVPVLIADLRRGYALGFVTAGNILIMLAALMIVHMFIEASSSPSA